jgi:hypothetical protein
LRRKQPGRSNSDLRPYFIAQKKAEETTGGTAKDKKLLSQKV